MKKRIRQARADEAIAFEFLNEVGIIGQLGSNRMQRTLPHLLTRSQFSVLNWFARVDSEGTPGRLARAFQVTPGAMTNTLSKLTGKGFLRVESDPASARSKIVTMTPAGRRAREAGIVAVTEDLHEFLAEFPAARLKRVLPLLKNIREYLDADRDPV